MKKALCLLMAMALSLTTFGCSLTGGSSAAPAVQTAQTQLNATVAAVNAYCAVASPADLEVQKVCATVQDAVSVSQPVVDLALNTLLSILTKRSARARALEQADCGH